MRHLLALVFAALPTTIAVAQPMPPCAAEPVPAYGETGEAPRAGIWIADELRAARWTPAACLGWSGDTKLVAAVASRFQAGDNVFDRAMDVSAWPSVRYWSVSTQSWRPLVVAVTAVDSAGRRAGNVSQSLASGRDSLFVERDENGGETTYRMRVLERSDHRMVVATDNVTPIKIAFVTAFEPGALQTVTFVQKEAGNSWNTYQIARVGSGGSSMASKHKGSFLNRFEAIRRYLAGQPTDQQPPLAPR
jgi:hypothetical protein